MISKRLGVGLCALVVALASVACPARDKPTASLLHGKFDRVRDTLAQQSSPFPQVNASSGLLQVAYMDFVRQIAPAGSDTCNYDNS
ncbi:MAG: hypothetical protein WAL56_02275 [Candidatus Sulfotelmatobacter sp.]